MKITAILFVPDIETSLPFWIERMGFVKTVEVPHEGKIGFAIVQKGGANLMLQSVASAKADNDAAAAFAESSRSALFIDVDDFSNAAARLEGYPIAMPVRDTFYGMREIGVLAPGGHLVVFAAKSA